MNQTLAEVNKPKLFLSYAREDDEPFVRRLYVDLTKAGFDVWFDRVSMPSRQLTFFQEIRDAIAARQRLLLVVGPGAVTSDYVTQEWQFAFFAANKCINPIVRLDGLEDGRKVDGYDLVPEDLKLLHAVDFRDDCAYDEHLENMVRQLSEDLPPIGKLVAVPELPPGYRAQPERLRALRDLLLLDLKKPVVVTGAAARVGLQGMGGIGKSVMANALARHPEVRRAFPDGIFWISLGQVPHVVALQRWLARELGDNGQFNDVQTGKERLRERLAERAVLLILDNVWQREHAEAFNVIAAKGKILLTTRDAGLVTALAAKENHYQVQLPTIAEAEAILASTAQIDPDTLPLEAREIIDACGRLPLALALCGGMVHGGISWCNLLDAINDHDLGYLSTDHPAEEQHRDAWKAMDVSVRVLPEEQRDRFAELAVFGKDAAVPEEAVATLWDHTAGMAPRHAQKLLAEFLQRSLVQQLSAGAGGADGGRVYLHDLLHAFAEGMAKKRFGSQSALHQTLLDAYRKKCPAGWPSGPDDGYFFDHLAQHLAATDNYPELRALFSDQKWLEARVPVSGYDYFGYIADLSEAWEMADHKSPEDEEILADCVRYGLIRTSINSLASNYAPELVVMAVKSGLWSPERALGVAERTPSREQACKFFTLLISSDKLTGTLRLSAGNKALDAALAIRLEQSRANALAALARQLTGIENVPLLRKVFDAALAIRGEQSRANVLAAVARQLTGIENAPLLSKALDAALAIGHAQSRAEALTAVAGQLTDAEKAAALSKALDAALAIKDEQLETYGFIFFSTPSRARILAAVAGQLTGIEKATALSKALDDALAIGHEPSRAWALADVARQLTGIENVPLLSKALDAALAIGDTPSRANTLAAVARQLTGAEKAALLSKALDTALAIDKGSSRVWAVAAVARQLTGAENAPLLSKALDAVLPIGNGGLRVDALDVVARQLTGAENAPLLSKALDAALAIGDKGWRAKALIVVARQLAGAENAPLVSKALNAALAIRGEMSRMALAAIAGHLTGAENAPLLNKALDAALAIGDENSWAETLVAMARQLTGAEKAPLPIKALDAVLAIGDAHVRAEALTAMAGQLTGAEKAAALRMALDALAIGDGKWRAEALTAIAEQLTGAEKAAALTMALDDALAIGDGKRRAKALTAIADQLTGTEKAAALRMALDALAIGDTQVRDGFTFVIEHSLAEALTAIAGQLTGAEKAAVLRMALDAALACKIEQSRAWALADVVRQLTGIENVPLLSKALDAAFAIGSEEWRASALAAVAGKLGGIENAPLLSKALDAALAIGDEKSRAKALTAVAGQLSGAEKATLLSEALNAVRAIGDEGDRIQALAGIAAHLKTATARKNAREFFHWLQNFKRTSFLNICTELLPNLTLQPKTYEAIAGHLIEICSEWRWM